MPFYYNRIAAANYGTKWAVPGTRNSTWPDFSSSQGGGGDCTNFISQCLYAGGWNMRQEGYLINPYAWYCRPKRHWDHSKSWASADHFAYFLKISGRARPCNLNELMLGDLIAEEITDHGIRHWMLVTQVSPQLALSYHSTDYLNTPFQDVQTRVGTQGSLSYWKIFDFYADADPPFYYSSVQDPYQKAVNDFLLQQESPPPRT